MEIQIKFSMAMSSRNSCKFMDTEKQEMRERWQSLEFNQQIWSHMPDLDEGVSMVSEFKMSRYEWLHGNYVTDVRLLRYEKS